VAPTSGRKWKTIVFPINRKVEADSDVQLILCNEPEPQGRNSPLVTHMPLDAVEVTVEVKSSECDSSEESVGPKDSALNRLVDVESQPVYTFPEPLEEATIDLNGITDEEKTIHWDFFEGRPSKTPERYVKIRNSIVQEWRRVKPRYLTKTSVRPMRWYRRERTIVLNLFWKIKTVLK